MFLCVKVDAVVVEVVEVPFLVKERTVTKLGVLALWADQKIYHAPKTPKSRLIRLL